MKLTPKQIINVGICSLLITVSIMSVLIIKTVTDGTTEVDNKIDSIDTLFKANIAVRYYGGDSHDARTLDNMQRLSSSRANVRLKETLELTSKDRFNRYEHAEKAILAGTDVNVTDAIGWLTTLQLTAASDIIISDSKLQYLAAPAQFARHLSLVACLVLMVSAFMLIGIGIGLKIYPSMVSDK